VVIVLITCCAMPGSSARVATSPMIASVSAKAHPHHLLVLPERPDKRLRIHRRRTLYQIRQEHTT